MPGASATNPFGIRIEEADGSPSAICTKLVLPNGTVAITGGAATYTPAAGKFTVAGSTTTAGTGGVTAFGPANGHLATSGTEGPTFMWVAAVAGTIDLLVAMNGTVFDANDQVTVTVRKGSTGGAMADTALTLSLPNSSPANTPVQDAVNSFTVVAGDRVCMKYVTSAGYSTASVLMYGFRFTPS